MLIDEVLKYYHKENYNCAESMIHGANDYYNLGLNDHDMKMTAAFGLGMQTMELCGVYSAAACIVSMKYVETKAHETKDLTRIMKKMTNALKERMGSNQCKEIRPNFFQREIRCQNTVTAACEVIEQVINEIDNDR